MQRIIERTHVGEVLQHIYASELDMKITFFSQGGYYFIGQDGGKKPLQGTTIEEVVTSLAVRIAHDFPFSGFAGWWASHYSSEWE